MDSKLSELKAAERFDADIEENGGEPFAVWAAAINGSHVFAKDYDALLAGLEEKEQHNTLLQCEIDHGKKLRVNLQNSIDSLNKRIAELEQRLATPVLLPKRWDISGQVNPPRIVQVQFEQQNRTLDQCAESIRAAGFTVGDE